LGGARPKATVIWEDKPYLAKFTLSMDKRNEALIEYATMSLAKKAGLHVPTIDRTIVSNRDVYLIQRFDRENMDKPIPFMSGLTATGLHEQDYPQWSYYRLVDAINHFCLNPIEDKIELFKRMVFNILVFNNDDHMRNHGFVYVGGKKWALSPLYDVLPSNITAETYMLSMKIGDKGKEASLENARSAAPYFGIAPAEANQYIHELLQSVRDWQSHFHSLGVSDADIEKVRHSFREFKD
jgi:serine/threonine-protein kinase HipA